MTHDCIRVYNLIRFIIKIKISEMVITVLFYTNFLFVLPAPFHYPKLGFCLKTNSLFCSIFRYSEVKLTSLFKNILVIGNSNI